MILVILGIAILGIIGGILIACYANEDEIGFGISGISLVVLVIALIATIWLGVDVSRLGVIDDKIEMYQEENTKIEEQISAAVESYQKYETDVFTEVKGESAISLVALYPELKADTLVQKQIEVYLANNTKIKELKEEQINGDVIRWWLYFGGSDNE